MHRLRTCGKKAALSIICQENNAAKKAEPAEYRKSPLSAAEPFRNSGNTDWIYGKYATGKMDGSSSFATMPLINPVNIAWMKGSLANWHTVLSAMMYQVSIRTQDALTPVSGGNFSDKMIRISYLEKQNSIFNGAPEKERRKQL